MANWDKGMDVGKVDWRKIIRIWSIVIEGYVTEKNVLGLLGHVHVLCVR